MPFIQLFDRSKHEFTDSLGNLKRFTPEISTIAFALTFINRFTGHAGSYSVAEHSILVYRKIAQGFPDDYELQLSALLHDATEAYLGDVSSPLKRLLPDYKLIEDFYHDVIDNHFGIKTRESIIKAVDERMLVTEAHALGFDLILGELNHLKPYGDVIVKPIKNKDEVVALFASIAKSLIEKIELKKRAI